MVNKSPQSETVSFSEAVTVGVPQWKRPSLLISKLVSNDLHAYVSCVVKSGQITEAPAGYSLLESFRSEFTAML